jgi:hypothetical protein
MNYFFFLEEPPREEGTAQKSCGERCLSIALHPSAFPPICKSLLSKRSDDSERAFASFPNPCRFSHNRNFGGENLLVPFARAAEANRQMLPGYY